MTDCKSPKSKTRENYFRKIWRRERDSNPRWSSTPHTPLAGERLQPLGHLSSHRQVQQYTWLY